MRYAHRGVIGGLLLASALSGGVAPLGPEPLTSYHIADDGPLGPEILRHHAVQKRDIPILGVYGETNITQEDLLKRICSTDIVELVTPKQYQGYRVLEPFLPTNTDPLEGLQSLARMASIVSGKSTITFNEKGEANAHYETSLEHHDLRREMDLMGELANYVFPTGDREERDRFLTHIYSHVVEPVPDHWADSVELFILEAVVQNALLELTKEQALNKK